ncbi:MAG TPA: anti-sigma factor [Mycobacteriales bacterium]|nr:anti-sigma factor [Mycobacteriales bacterium]
MSKHEHWEELAAGHALDALEPEETELFTAHLATCGPCQASLADHAFVAAQLGTIVNEQAGAPSWSRMRGHVVEPVHEVAPVTSLADARARRRSPRLLAAAASLVLLTGGTVVAWQVTRSDAPSAQEQVLAACSAQPGCHAVDLQGKATVVVADGSARLLATSLPPAGDGRVYVLWQLPRGGRPTMVARLSGAAAGTVGEAHPLALPYEDTAAFGVSREPASVVPTGPTDVVALGNA